MKNLSELTQRVIEFRDKRDWKQFHTPKDMALSLTLEAAEVLELFQWVKDAAAAEHANSVKDKLAHELSDVLYWVLLMAHDFKIDLESAFAEKMALNEKKYPAEKFRGSSEKYS